MTYLFYHEIHLLRFIFCYCTPIYKEYIILFCWFCNHHKNFTYITNNHNKNLLISQILNQFFCNIFKRNFSLQTSKSTTFQYFWLPRRSKHWKTPTHSKHWNEELYRGQADRGEVDRESDLNHLDLVILR